MEAVLVQDWRHRRATGTTSDGGGGTSDADEEDGSASVLSSRLQIDVKCDYGLLPADRSTGVVFSASSDPAATTSTVATSDGTSAENVAAMIPVGEAYYNALREAWSRPPPPPVGPPTMASALPPPVDEDSLDDSFILDSIEQMEGPPLSPVVPLGYMVDLLTPQWEEEGLYDVARRREQRSQALEQETGRRV